MSRRLTLYVNGEKRVDSDVHPHGATADLWLKADEWAHVCATIELRPWWLRLWHRITRRIDPDG